MENFTVYLLEGKVVNTDRLTDGKNFKFKNITNKYIHKYDYPFVITQGSVLGIGVNRILINRESKIVLKYEFIDTRLLNQKEYDSLLENLIKETLNEDSLKRYRKYTALKNITN